MKFTTDFECSPRVLEYVYDIADEMVRLFDIPPSEAAGRINNHWRGRDFVTESDELALLHGDPDRWANMIYFGHEAVWRSRVEGPQPPLPYP